MLSVVKRSVASLWGIRRADLLQIVFLEEVDDETVTVGVVTVCVKQERKIYHLFIPFCANIADLGISEISNTNPCQSECSYKWRTYTVKYGHIVFPINIYASSWVELHTVSLSGSSNTDQKTSSKQTTDNISSEPEWNACARNAIPKRQTYFLMVDGT